MYEIMEDRFMKIPLEPLKNEEHRQEDSSIVDIVVTTDDNIDQFKIEMELSKEAMIGFGTSLLRLYMEEPSEQFDIRTTPMKEASIATQPLGFWLTPDSNEYFLYYKEFSEQKSMNEDEIKNYEEHSNYNYLVDLEWDDDYLESYQLNFTNVSRLRLLDKSNNVINHKYIIMYFSKQALFRFGVELLRLAHRYTEANVYQASDLGINLTKTSPEFKIIAKTFKTVRELI